MVGVLFAKKNVGVLFSVWVQGSGFKVQGSGFRVQGSGFRVQVQGSGFRVQGSGLWIMVDERSSLVTWGWVWGLALMGQGLGIRDSAETIQDQRLWEKLTFYLGSCQGPRKALRGGISKVY